MTSLNIKLQLITSSIAAYVKGRWSQGETQRDQCLFLFHWSAPLQAWQILLLWSIPSLSPRRIALWQVIAGLSMTVDVLGSCFSTKKEQLSPQCVDRNCCRGTSACMKRQQEQTNWPAGVPHCTQHGVSLQLWVCQNIYNIFKRMIDTVWLPHGAWNLSQPDLFTSLFIV